MIISDKHKNMDKNIRLLKKNIQQAVKKHQKDLLERSRDRKTSNSRSLFQSDKQDIPKLDLIYKKIENIKSFHSKSPKLSRDQTSPMTRTPLKNNSRSPNPIPLKVYSEWELSLALKLPKSRDLRIKRRSLLNSLRSYEPIHYKILNEFSSLHLN
jgi:hypothetical protein